MFTVIFRKTSAICWTPSAPILFSWSSSVVSVCPVYQKNVNKQEREFKINFVISESISQIFSTIVFDVIFAKIECDERLLKNNNAAETDEQKMVFTVLFWKALAKCWAPSELMSLSSKLSVVSVWEKLTMGVRTMKTKWYSLYYHVRHQLNIELPRLQFHCIQDPV